MGARPCLCDVIPSNSKLAGSRQLTWYPSQGLQNVFFQQITHFTIFTAIILGIWSMLGSKKKMAQPMDKIPWTLWCHKNVAWLLSTVKNGSYNVKFWASLETNFIRKTSRQYQWVKINNWKLTLSIDFHWLILILINKYWLLLIIIAFLILDKFQLNV